MKASCWLFFPLLVLGFSIWACSALFDPGRSSEPEIFTVEAQEGWHNTQIRNSEGDLLTITVLSGKWSPWPGSEFDALGSGGDPRCRCNVIQGVSHAALIGRIGDQEPFLIGERYHRAAGESGILYLGINDVDLYDDSGALRVEVEID